MKQRGTHPSLPRGSRGSLPLCKGLPHGCGMIGIDLAEVFFKDGRHGLPYFLKDGFAFDPMVPLQARSVKAETVPKEKMMPLWVLTFPVARNMAFSAAAPMGRSTKERLTTSRKFHPVSAMLRRWGRIASVLF